MSYSCPVPRPIPVYELVSSPDLPGYELLQSPDLPGYELLPSPDLSGNRSNTASDQESLCLSRDQASILGDMRSRPIFGNQELDRSCK